MADEDGVVAPEAPKDVSPEDTPEETPEELKARLAKAEELANNYKVRAEKAEKRIKEAPPAPVPSEDKEVSLTLKDQIFLSKADIHEDDIEDVLDWAKTKKVSVSEAYKQFKPMLEVRSEERKTAETSNISPSREVCARRSLPQASQLGHWEDKVQ
jgi:hypothetical protein